MPVDTPQARHRDTLLARIDADLREPAAAALDCLLGDGRSLDQVCQADVQRFCWHTLPRLWAARPEGPEPALRALAAVLDTSGRRRYAAICRSDITLSIVRSPDDQTRRQAYRHAVAASGVEPPDTDLLAWGQAGGPDETSVHTAAARALEAALVSGDLVPGGRTTPARARRLTHHFLLTEQLAWRGRRAIDVVHAERRQRWAGLPRSARYTILHPVLPSLSQEPTPPGDMAMLLGPLSWLLAAIHPRITLTPAGYLPPRLAADAAQRFGWRPRSGAIPRSEAGLAELGAIRTLLARTRLTAPTRHGLRTTSAGLRALVDARSLWQTTVTSMGTDDDFSATVTELGLAALLRANTGLSIPELETACAAAVSERFEHRDGSAPRHREIGTVIDGWHLAARALGLATAPRAVSAGADVIALTPAGRAAAVGFLREQAHRPRRFPW